MKCHECGTENKDNSKFCVKCGVSLEKEEYIFCEKCGYKNEKNSMFCEECGEKLVQEEVIPLQDVNYPKKKPIGLIVILLIALVLVGVYFGKDYFLKDDNNSNWGDTYYLYLTDAKTDSEKLEEAKLSLDMTDATINFYDVESIDEPVMIITYKDDEDYTNIYYIEEDNVKVISDSTSSDIELLYSVSDDSYEYFLYEEESYKSLNDIVSNKNFDVEDKDITLNKDYIEVEVSDAKEFDINSSDEELKEVITTMSDEYQIKEEIVENNIDEINETKEKIEKYSNIEDIYLAYIKSGDYEEYEDEYIDSYDNYLIMDINDDGINELFISRDDDMGWTDDLVFTYDIDKEEIVFIDEIYAYSGISYDKDTHEIVYTSIRSAFNYSYYGFYILEDNEFICSKSVNHDSYGDYQYYTYDEDKNKIELTEEEYEEYFENIEDLEYLSIRDID